MNRTNRRKEWKVPRGIALSPALWERIEQVAEAQEKTRSQVCEEVLSLHVPCVTDSQKSQAKAHTSGDDIEWED